jgi:hypothetical protein
LARAPSCLVPALLSIHPSVRPLRRFDELLPRREGVVSFSDTGRQAAGTRHSRTGREVRYCSALQAPRVALQCNLARDCCPRALWLYPTARAQSTALFSQLVPGPDCDSATPVSHRKKSSPLKFLHRAWFLQNFLVLILTPGMLVADRFAA